MKGSKFTILMLLLMIFFSCVNSTKSSLISELHFDTLYYPNTDKFEIITLAGRERHGVAKIFHNKYGKIGEKLYLHDKLLISQELGGDSLTAGYTYYYNLNDSMVPIGSIIYDRSRFQRIDIMCTYFELEAPDSIIFGQPYKVKIYGNIGIKNNFNLSLTLGELDPNFRLSNKKASYLSKGKSLEFTISDYKEGINLLTGSIKYFENGKDITKENNFSHINFPLVFYKQFIAVPSK